MATNTIHTLSYKLLVDSTQFEAGMTASKKELNAAKKVMRETINPMERYQNGVDKINDLLGKGVINQDIYNRKLKQLQTNLHETTKRTTIFTRSLSKMQGAFAGGLAAISTGAVLNGLKTQLNEIDQLGKKAAAIGADVEFLSGLEFVAQRTSGLVEGGATKAIEKMNLRIARAAAGGGEAKQILIDLGLEASKLTKQKPAETFRKIARAMDGIADAGERSRIATALFDDEQQRIHMTMALATAEYEKQIELAQKLNAITTEKQAAEAAIAADAIGEVTAAVDALKREGAIAAAPALTAWSQLITGLRTGDVQNAFQGRDNVSLALESDKAEYWAARDKEAAEAAKREEKQKAEMRAKLIEQQKESNEVQSKAFGKFLSNNIKGLSERGIGLIGRAANSLGRIDINGKSSKQVVTSAGPADSLAAGSSAAFKFLNQTKSTKTVEVDLLKEQLKKQREQVTILSQMKDLMKLGEDAELVNL